MLSETGPTNVEGVKRVTHAELRRGRKRENEKDKRRNVKSTRKKSSQREGQYHHVHSVTRISALFIGNIVLVGKEWPQSFTASTQK